jgi:hypothetical protein
LSRRFLITFPHNFPERFSARIPSVHQFFHPLRTASNRLLRAFNIALSPL